MLIWMCCELTMRHSAGAFMAIGANEKRDINEKETKGKCKTHR
jgi:hypothetical protein